MAIRNLRALSRLTLRKSRVMLADLFAQLRDGEIQLVAASLSFSTILSLVPFLAVILATFKFMGGDDILYARVENLLLLYFKEAAGSDFTRVIRVSIRKVHAGGLGGWGAAFLVLTSFRLLHDMEYGINRIWNQKNTRPLFKRIFTYWFLVVLLPIFLAIYVGIMTLIKMQVENAYLPGAITGGAVLILILYMVYRFVPDLQVKRKSAFFSAFVAAAGLIVVHNTFTWVVVKFFRYNNIYGSFAALPIFLIWTLTIWYVILGGVAICASTQRRRLLEKDLTLGV
jgi:membrane protein